VSPSALPPFGRARVLVVGDCMLDRYLWGEVRRISPEGPVPVVRLRERSETLGGGGNVAANLAALGSPVTLLAVRGDDGAGRRLAALAADRGIDACLLTDPDRPTVTKTRVIAGAQQLLRLDEEDTGLIGDGVRRELLARVEERLDDCRALILSDYGKGVLGAPEVCPRLIGMARQRDIHVLVDPKGPDWRRYRGASCITPNTAELRLATGLTESADRDRLLAAADDVCRRLALERLLLTRGARGMCLVDGRGEPRIIRARAREVFDVSGAGDTVVAVMAAGLAVGLGYEESARLANLAAGLVVGKLGTQPATSGELEAALRLEADRDGTMPAKELSLDAALMQVKAWRAAGHRIVFTNGCFDLLHPGHINLLHRARSLGDRLVVGLNTDASVRRLKGPQRPILSQQDRSALLSALGSVDLVLLFDEDTPLNLIRAIRPDILVKGADYRREDVVGGDVVESYGGRVRLVPLLAGYSTTDITRRILAADGQNKREKR